MSDISNEINTLQELISNIKLPDFLCPMQALQILDNTEGKISQVESSDDIKAIKEELFGLFARLNDELAMFYPMIRRHHPKQLRLVHDFATSLVSHDDSIQSLNEMSVLLAGFTSLKSPHIVN